MKSKESLLMSSCLVTAVFFMGCAEADTTERAELDSEQDSDSGSEDVDGDSDSQTEETSPSDTVSTDDPSTDDPSTDDPSTDDVGDTESETLPVEDTDWMDDPTIIYYATFNGSDGEFTTADLDGLSNPWEWGIPNDEEDIYYPSSADGRVWGTNLNGVHGRCQTAALTSKEFDLTSYAGKTFSLSWIQSHYYYGGPTEYQAGFTIELFDGVKWVAPEPPSCDGATCPSLECDSGWVTSAFTMVCNDAPLYLDGKPGFGGESCPWEKQQITIDWVSYPTDFKFRFVHGAASIGINTFDKPGAYIDNVELRVN